MRLQSRVLVPRLVLMAIPLALFEITAVLVLRAHWTMDVFTGLLAALWVAGWVEKPARWLDGVVGGIDEETRP